MDDFQGLLGGDFGLKAQGKSAPMAPPRNSPADGFSNLSSPPSYGLGSSGTDFTRSSSSSAKKSDSMPVFDDHDRTSDDLLFNDVFGGLPKHRSTESRARSPPLGPTFDYDAMFKGQSTSKSASMPVFDEPVYDDDIFEGIPGLKSSSSSASARFDNVFASNSSSPPKHTKQSSSPFDDLFGDFGPKATEPKKAERVREENDTSVFDDLIPGFGHSSSPPANRSTSEKRSSQKASSVTMKQGSTSTFMDDDPFSVFKSASTPVVSSSRGFSDPLKEHSKFSSPRNKKTGHSSAEERTFDDLDPLDGLSKSVPELNNSGRDRSDERTGNMNGMQSPIGSSGSHSPSEALVDDFQDSHCSPSVSIPHASPAYVDSSENGRDSQMQRPSRSDKNFKSSDDVWLTVSEIPLFTQPTSAPPPSRPPPPRPTRPLKKNVNEPSSSSSSAKFPYSPRSARASSKNSVGSQIDELEEFAMGRTHGSANGYYEVHSAVASDANSVAATSAAAMKDAMEKAEAKFRHAREMREKESKATRIKEGIQMENNDFQERDREERLERERLEREREMERAREIEKEKEEREKERRRVERERIEKERELARQAVERATREARERASAEARAKAQRAAVEKAAAEARERAERNAVQRAQAEARERAAVEARERAEKAAAERANAEAREREAREKEARARVERAAVEKAAAEARQRAAAQARANQQRNETDFDFFNMGSRPSSAPRERANSSDPQFATQNKGGAFDAAKTSSGTVSNVRKASSTTNFVDDLSSIFGAAASQSMEFQDVEGETEERRRARLERHQRTKERAAKALAEKNERDLQAQREQAEKHRIGGTLDAEIKRWAAGKEGNLRALLSTLQYVLWPECGWQPVSLTDLITAASVKKVYRKATLCIHPDKVQQKGANIQQKYVAEKVFDLLKEAWNKFNSEELF